MTNSDNFTTDDKLIILAYCAIEILRGNMTTLIKPDEEIIEISIAIGIRNFLGNCSEQELKEVLERMRTSFESATEE